MRLVLLTYTHSRSNKAAIYQLVGVRAMLLKDLEAVHWLFQIRHPLLSIDYSNIDCNCLASHSVTQSTYPKESLQRKLSTLSRAILYGMQIWTVQNLQKIVDFIDHTSICLGGLGRGPGSNLSVQAQEWTEEGSGPGAGAGPEAGQRQGLPQISFSCPLLDPLSRAATSQWLPGLEPCPRTIFDRWHLQSGSTS